MHIRPVRVFLALALTLVATLPLSGRSTVAGADLAEGVRFRSEMGFRTDLDFVTAVALDIRSSWKYGVALTPSEEAEIDRRLEIEAQTGPLSRHLKSVPTYAGGYTDQASGHVFVIGFTDDPAKHEGAIQPLLPIGAKYRLRQVPHTLAELMALQERITGDRDELATVGISVTAIIVDEIHNQVEVGVANLRDQDVSSLTERYGKGILSVFGSGGGIPSACTNRSHCYGPPLRAGINVDQTGCSLGFVVVQSGVRRILTAGHVPCGSATGTLTHDGVGFGTVRTRSWFGGDAWETADAATIGNLTAAQDDNLVYRTSTTTNAVGVAQSFDSETYSNIVCLSGRTKEAVRCGTRVTTNATICFSEGCLREQREATFELYIGDSGGAVYDGGSIAIGIQSSCIDRNGNGICDEGNTVDNALYGHIRNVFTELGGSMSLYTGN